MSLSVSVGVLLMLMRTMPQHEYHAVCMKAVVMSCSYVCFQADTQIPGHECHCLSNRRGTRHSFLYIMLTSPQHEGHPQHVKYLSPSPPPPPMTSPTNDSCYDFFRQQDVLKLLERGSAGANMPRHLTVIINLTLILTLT